MNIRTVFLLVLHAMTFMLFAQSTNAIAELEKRLGIETNSDSILSMRLRLGNLYFTDSDFPKALECYFAVAKSAEKDSSDYRLGGALSNIGSVYFETGKYDLSISYAKRAVQAFGRNKNYSGLGNAYTALGNSYYLLEKDSLALTNFQEAVKYGELAQDSAHLFSAYKNLVGIYDVFGDTAKCFQYMKKAITYLKPDDSKNRWFAAYLTLAEVCIYNGRLEEGKKVLIQAEKLMPEIKTYYKFDDFHYAWYYYYREKGNCKKALESYKLYDQFKDSVDNVSRSKQLEELNIQYETEKKEIRLEQQAQTIVQEKQKKRLYVLLMGSIILF